MPAPTSYGTKYELFNVDFQRGDVFHFFNENQRSEYFNSKRISRGTINSYIRVDESFRVGDTYVDILACNYCRYDNDDGAGWRYAYVTKMEVVSTTVTELFIQQDPWQNNMFSFEFHGTRLRGHVDRLHYDGSQLFRTPSFTSEPINATLYPKEVITTSNTLPLLWGAFSTYLGDTPAPTSFLNDGFVYYCWPFGISKTSYTLRLVQSAGTTEKRVETADMWAGMLDAKLVNAYYSTAAPPGMSWTYDSESNVLEVVIVNTMAVGAIETFKDTNELEHEAILYAILPAFSGGVSSYLNIPNNNFLTITPSPSDTANILYESKLFASPFFETRYGIAGRESVFDYKLMPDERNFALPYINVPTGNGMISTIKTPTNYNGGSTDIDINRNNVSFNAPILRDAETMFLQSNTNRLNAQLVNSLIGATSAKMSYGKLVVRSNVNELRGPISTLIGQGATMEDLRATPDRVEAIGDAINAFYFKSDSPYFLTATLKEDDLDRAYSFFYTYGYTINEWQEKNYANIRSRYYFDYYQYAADVHADIDDSATARDIMQEDLQNGVTFWHYTDNGIGIQHRYENLEISIIQAQQGQ